MENGRSTIPSFESSAGEGLKSNIENTKKASKRSSNPEVINDTRRHKAEQDIARSLEKFSILENRQSEKSMAVESSLVSPPHETATETITADIPEAKDVPAKSSERLSAGETTHSTQKIAQQHLVDLHETQAEPSDELAPVEAFLEKVAVGGDVTEAYYETLAEFDLEPPESEIADETDEPPQPESEPEPEATPEAGVINTDQTGEGEITLTTTSDDETVSSPPADNGGAGGNGGGNGPTPPGGTPPGAPPPSGGGPGNGPSFNPNYATAAAAPNVVPATTVAYLERRGQNSGLLVGGIIGYLLGRRRGRIKTERRLLPIQKKLERQVKSLEQTINAKEQQLSQAVRARQNPNRPARPAAAHRLEQSAAPKPASPEVTASPRHPGLAERTQPGRQETRLGMEKPRRAEQLGHMIVAAESPTRVLIERPNSIRQAFRPEHVKTMHRNELLELSEKIVIEGASLRHIYESHLIGEKQLRHLVSEYLDGKDIRRQLRREMIEREIDFERDPILRDRVRSQLTTRNVSLNQMLEKVGVLPITDEADEQQSKRAAEKARKRAAKQQRQHLLADGGMVALIIILAVVAAVLLLGH